MMVHLRLREGVSIFLTSAAVVRCSTTKKELLTLAHSHSYGIFSVFIQDDNRRVFVESILTFIRLGDSYGWSYYGGVGWFDILKIFISSC